MTSSDQASRIPWKSTHRVCSLVTMAQQRPLPPIESGKSVLAYDTPNQSVGQDDLFYPSNKPASWSVLFGVMPFYLVLTLITVAPIIRTYVTPHWADLLGVSLVLAW